MRLQHIPGPRLAVLCDSCTHAASRLQQNVLSLNCSSSVLDTRGSDLKVNHLGT